jgi:signal transduction histidine kinase
MATPPAADAIPLRRTVVDIRDVLRWSLEILHRQADTFDVRLRVDIDDNVPVGIALDERKMAWAITALVGNALRYVRRGSQMMPGGSIDVHVSYDSSAAEMAIDVQDDGPGISMDRLPSLFDPATRTAGVALGLSMVKDVVEAHGGTFRIESDTRGPSRGTTVRLTLPVPK